MQGNECQAKENSDCYNTCMRKTDQIVIAIFLLLPLIVLGILKPNPIPRDILDASYEINSITDNAGNDVERLTLLLQFQPWRSDLWERLGRDFLNKEAYSDAINAFKNGDKNGDLSIVGKIAWADALISSGDIDSAKQLLRANGSEGDSLINFLQITALQRRIGDVYGAEATLQNANRLFPENGEVLFELGLMLSTTQPESAVQFLTKSQPGNQNDKLLKNALLATLEATNDGVVQSERFLQIGQVLSTFNAWDAAAQAFESSLAEDPESALALAYLGEAKQRLGENGFSEINHALKLAPENEIVNGLAGLYFRRQEKYDLAVFYLDKASQLNQQANVWLIEKGRTYEQMGDLEKAYQLFKDATDLSPEDYTTWKALSVFCITHNYDVETSGLTAARMALSLNPSSSVLADLLGTGLMITGDYDSAERFFLQALRLDPNQSAIFIHLGQLKILQKDFPAAQAYLQQAVDFAPDNRLRDLAIQLLDEIPVQ